MSRPHPLLLLLLLLLLPWSLFTTANVDDASSDISADVIDEIGPPFANDDDDDDVAATRDGMSSFARSLAAMKLAMEADRVGIGDGDARVSPTWNVDRRAALNAIRMHPPPPRDDYVLVNEAPEALGGVFPAIFWIET
jgi:hypothetical protein